MSKKEKIILDQFHYHEMCDRSYLMVNTIEEQLLEHSVAIKNKKIRKLIKKASKHIAEVSQIAGALEFKMDKPNNK